MEDTNLSSSCKKNLQSSWKPTFEKVLARSSISDKDPKTAAYEGGETQKLVAKKKILI